QSLEIGIGFRILSALEVAVHFAKCSFFVVDLAAHADWDDDEQDQSQDGIDAKENPEMVLGQFLFVDLHDNAPKIQANYRSLNGALVQPRGHPRFIYLAGAAGA